MSLPLEVAKAEARRRARAIRAQAHDPRAGQALVPLFPEFLRRHGPVAGYHAVGFEIDPRPLLVALATAGATIVLPRMLSRAEPPVFLKWREGEALGADAFGLPAPRADAEAAEPALLLCPLLAFDRKGGRLGQGGGHYDRVLARLKPLGAIAVGLAFAAQEVDAVPTGPHDQRLDWIITDKEAIEI